MTVGFAHAFEDYGISSNAVGGWFLEAEPPTEMIKRRGGSATPRVFPFLFRDAAFADPRRATGVGPHFEPLKPPSARAFRVSNGR
jgi:hypothetical protein